MEKLKIHKALSLLSDKDREIITLKILNNLSGRDISKIMGIPEEQVPMYTRRAKLRLRKIWKGMAA
jgi:RNA polymerase sigma factor (sigma-70 family)